jgi:hypothetical protein
MKVIIAAVKVKMGLGELFLNLDPNLSLSQAQP